MATYTHGNISTPQDTPSPFSLQVEHNSPISPTHHQYQFHSPASSVHHSSPAAAVHVNTRYPVQAPPSLEEQRQHLQAKIAKARQELDEIVPQVREICEEHDRLYGWPKRISREDRTVFEQAMIEQAHLFSKKHVGMLMKFNEMRDVAMGLLGMIAEREGRTLREIMEERGVERSEYS